MTVNDLPVGRNVDETLRLIKAFQFVEKHGEGNLISAAGRSYDVLKSCFIFICSLPCQLDAKCTYHQAKPQGLPRIFQQSKLNGNYGGIYCMITIRE